jgi:hypothetical protein
VIDQKTVEQARKTDMVTFFGQRHGFTFMHQGNTYRCRQHPSLAVKDDRLSWYWHSQGIGGHGAIDYLMKMERLPFRQAVEVVAGIGATTPLTQEKQQSEKALCLPEKRWVPLRLYAYLCQKRGIDFGIVNTLMEEGKLYEDKQGNVVFVGFDEQGQARFASLRGTYGDRTFRMDCAGSDKQYGFTMAAYEPSERLYVFESPIDAMSHASLEKANTGDEDAWKRHSRLSLAGTSDAALPLFLNQYPTVKELAFCLDNDPPGRKAAVTLTRKYSDMGFYTRIELPTGKDVNEDLAAHIAAHPPSKRSKHTLEKCRKSSLAKPIESTLSNPILKEDGL